MNPIRELKKIAAEMKELENLKEADTEALVTILRQMADVMRDTLESEAVVDKIAPGKLLDAFKALDLDKHPEGKKLVRVFEEL